MRSDFRETLSLKPHHLPSASDTDWADVVVIFRSSDESPLLASSIPVLPRVVPFPTPEQSIDLILSQPVQIHLLSRSARTINPLCSLCLVPQGFAPLRAI